MVRTNIGSGIQSIKELIYLLTVAVLLLIVTILVIFAVTYSMIWDETYSFLQNRMNSKKSGTTLTKPKHGK